MDMIKEVVYHGTSKFAADNILHHGFKCSKKKYEWLGHGVYFFKHIETANHWANNMTKYPTKKTNKYSNINNTNCNSSIIQCEISAPVHQYLNLSDPNDFNKFKSFVDTIISEMEDCDDELPDFTYNGKHDYKIERCFWLNLYSKQNGIKIVSFKFPDICKETVHGVPILLPNLQFCVFDKHSIKNMREVSYDAI